MTKIKDTSSNRESRKSFWDAMNLGYLAAGVSTLVTAWFSIGENHAKDMYERKIPSFQNIETIRVNENAALKTDGKFGEYLKKRWDIEANYKREYNKLLAEYGIKSSLHKLLDLKPHQQIKVGLTIVVVAGIAWGATYSYIKDKKFSQQIEESKDAQIQRG